MSSTNAPKYVSYIGWIATFTAFCMYVSYIPQIMDNLDGNKTNPLQPAAAAINCILWVWYGLKVKDLPVAVANAPGVIFGIIACLTAF
ncbi:SemiSWEET family transporter [Moellerella wisconsensis]|uniref:SemiSWEET family transporter n=2 Tax=Moellerella wisconsensis TaxID=158849 RepID=A0ACD3Y7C3_9GAMM|nr:SemiSWEET family transporter [Moellerella wisconsensis]UNH24304.1 SemiSWEET family transporter [Moellerella wisconsensis]UNH27409.1 SemiSWEET family transporter [Moellerella wisconsensis]UNH30883.1 SemiSWEET family transporter [Moellerella wisconsensis]UNH39028.1 SemiSWEET family transporter [Moellerella wisconsensis]UNH42547.1 SemiSWEET family transporter [Moellerella wisconsensis]